MVGTSFVFTSGCQAALLHFKHVQVTDTDKWLLGRQAAGVAQPDASYLRVIGGVLRLRSGQMVTCSQVGTPTCSWSNVSLSMIAQRCSFG